MLNADLTIILLGPQNNFVRTLKIISNAAKNFDEKFWFECST